MKVAILGRGNVATHYLRALTANAPDIETIQCDPHHSEETPGDADCVIIAVSDSAIGEVADSLPPLPGAIVVHTSGSVPMEALGGVKAAGRGVLYPLQTLSRDREIDYGTLPLLTEGDTPEVLTAVDLLARRISRCVSHADSEARARLHLGAVFACNFTNLMCRIAGELLDERGLELQLLLPLVEETVAKLHTLTPREAQTGPAVRGDTAVMRRQYDALASHPDYQEVYAMLSRLIRESGPGVGRSKT